MYTQILFHNAAPTGRALICENFILQQENDLKGTAWVIKQCMENRTRDCILTILNWPAQGADMNMIEQVWIYMEMEN